MAGKKTRKCQRCKMDDTLMEDMEFEIVGEKRPQKKYFHKTCYQLHLKDKEFKRIEAEKLDKLAEVIKRIYGAKQIPNQAFIFLQRLRNGEQVFGKNQERSKRYKEGYDYLLLAETYDYCSETIERVNSTKGFNGFMSAFRYGLYIIIDKIYAVEQRKIQREKRKVAMEKHLEQVEEMEEQSFETNYKKPSKSKTDISDFLDD
ncbi:hypothetical protein [Bacillus phage vB_BanS-Thrax3]|nr:hypothetical protein [Bacillus phage vB_BanS-Thrax1]UUV46568.1 hypothetical protein [Bacillus phage vB_BanS-Thrax3]